MNTSTFKALLLDLDGTLVMDSGEVHPTTLQALQDLHQRGIVVMVATGRSEASSIPLLKTLGFSTPTILYNGAAIYCPEQEQLLKVRTLAAPQLERVLVYAEENDLMSVVMAAGAKYALAPRDRVQRLALHDMKYLKIVEEAELRQNNVIRVSLFSDTHHDSQAFYDAFVGETADAFVGETADDFYITHFALNLLASHRDSKLQVLDVHPQCEGKAEALNFLKENHNISPHEVIAIGDATNDLPMMRAAGLGIAMKNAMPEVLAEADQIIGHNNSDSIAHFVQSIFS